MNVETSRPTHTVLVVTEAKHQFMCKLQGDKTMSLLAKSFERPHGSILASAYWGSENSVLVGADENPKPGRLGATTSKVG